MEGGGERRKELHGCEGGLPEERYAGSPGPGNRTLDLCALPLLRH